MAKGRGVGGLGQAPERRRSLLDYSTRHYSMRLPTRRGLSSRAQRAALSKRADLCSVWVAAWAAASQHTFAMLPFGSLQLRVLRLSRDGPAEHADSPRAMPWPQLLDHRADLQRELARRHHDQQLIRSTWVVGETSAGPQGRTLTGP